MMNQFDKKARELEQTELFNIIDRRCKYEETTFDDIMDAVNDIFNAGFHKIPNDYLIITKEERKKEQLFIDNMKNVLEIEKENTRKETAREIFREIKNHCVRAEHYDNEMKEVAPAEYTWYEDDLKKLEQKYGVEVME